LSKKSFLGEKEPIGGKDSFKGEGHREKKEGGGCPQSFCAGQSKARGPPITVGGGGAKEEGWGGA